jgi:hypothetical protein
MGGTGYAQSIGNYYYITSLFFAFLFYLLVLFAAFRQSFGSHQCPGANLFLERLVQVSLGKRETSERSMGVVVHDGVLPLGFLWIVDLELGIKHWWLLRVKAPLSFII